MYRKLRYIFFSDDIAVDPNVACHTERSEVSMFNALVRLSSKKVWVIIVFLFF